MNFVGHAVVAWRERPVAAFAFGAMVPDLRRFTARVSPSPALDADVLEAGVAAHHRSDEAFHAHPAFKRWMGEVVDRMPASDRGARAAAHVAVELVIDGVLLRRGEAGAYADALSWAASTMDPTWRSLVERMQRGDIVAAYRSSAGVADRVVSVMNRRERLRRLGVEPGPLARALDPLWPSVEASLDDLLREVSGG